MTDLMYPVTESIVSGMGGGGVFKGKGMLFVVMMLWHSTSPRDFSGYEVFRVDLDPQKGKIHTQNFLKQPKRQLILHTLGVQVGFSLPLSHSNPKPCN